MTAWNTEMTWRWWLALAAGAFVTNLVWENAHGVLYDHLIPGWRFLRAAGGDVLLVGAGVGVTWPLRRVSTRAHLTVTVALLSLVAVVIEIAAQTDMRWGYTEMMPTIGGVGLSPLLQLPVTGLAAWWFAAWWTHHFGRTVNTATPAMEPPPRRTA